MTRILSGAAFSRALSVLLGFSACVGVLSAQSDMRGHWSGTVDTQIGALTIELDLDKTADGWIGSASIPAEGASGIPLSRITFADGKGSFYFNGPAAPGFIGTLSADGKTLDGTFAVGPQSVPLKLNRTGEVKIELPKASLAVDAEFVGTWEGTVSIDVPLRILLTISNGKDGAEAQMVSVDQGSALIPVSSITQTGTKLILGVKVTGGGYEGEMNKEGTEINGTWTQFRMSTPLLLKRAAAPAK